MKHARSLLGGLLKLAEDLLLEPLLVVRDVGLEVVVKTRVLLGEGQRRRRRMAAYTRVPRSVMLSIQLKRSRTS